MKTYTIYKLTSPEGKVYIGQTSRTPQERWRNGAGYKDNKLLFEAIKEQGWKNFKREILFQGLSIEEANRIEAEEIKKNNSLSPNGYNRMTGAGFNQRHSEESKAIMREKAIQRALSPEWHKKVSEGTRKFIDGLTDEERKMKYHRDWSEDSKIKMRESVKTANNTPEVKNKISVASIKMWANLTNEERNKRLQNSLKAMNSRSHGQRSIAAKKAWETRRKK